MTIDKYGAGQDPYCYPGTDVLRNHLGLKDALLLQEAERDLSRIAAAEIEFQPPPYGRGYLRTLHKQLFQDLYDWAGECRSVDISKDTTRFCTASRIIPEGNKLFAQMERAGWYEGQPREAVIPALAEVFGELNMVHPFREGNGRAQRLLFDHLIINLGLEINWWSATADEWIQANISAVHCDYSPLARIFSRCIGGSID
ncbi:putative adenosine monophosphate-protein transferase Fic [Pseudomonas sp. NPDC007930]|uniref:putative adenosine monophosphate-protein transferase Fic n=1 Tax=Pseudomonas sp. NPDC007930 TaxID=3364417 RepID=UPI0036E73021